ncbi:hypothetical protein R3P38DRAFT_2880421 [Favolaschia claudopus]|uniref:Uncharacterized protein n=1 Tax=Favolaschia claudopus TaxID=2862362 RepID=A0AAW0CXF9_9AGAR
MLSSSSRYLLHIPRRLHAHTQYIRRFSAKSSPVPPPPSPARTRAQIGIVCLSLFGVGALAYGGWDAYTTWRDLYPPAVRVDLKLGISAKNKGDRETSLFYKRKAWDTAVTLPTELFKSEPFLKVTGIAVDLAGELEEDGKSQEAFALYSEALDYIKRADKPLSERERFRAVSLAVKLGQLAESCPNPISAQEEETILVFAVEETLKLLMGTRRQEPLDMSTLKLPRGLTKTDVGVPLQLLGDFYGRVGKLEYAMPLYLQTISLLVPENPNKAPPEDICQGAHLMSNIAELLVARDTPSSEKRVEEAERWAHNALSLLQTTRKNTKEQIPTCELALCAALFNAGMLREMAGDDARARSFFKAAFQQSQSFGAEDGVDAAKIAMDRLNAKQNSP